jgi:Zn-dependent M28 family amino/carboxypeptidase
MHGKITADRLRAHVRTLAGEIGERNLGRPQQLRCAADYIEQTWREQGYTVVRHPYKARGEDCANLEITRRGGGHSQEIVLVGAHYDSVAGSPGANDNATGVAALLETARMFAGLQPNRSVRFVAFVNEEPPFFRTKEMGSRVYAKMARGRGDNIKAMLSLETIGYYNKHRGTQRYEMPFRFFYPQRGNFVAFVANQHSRVLLERTMVAFRAHSDMRAVSLSPLALRKKILCGDHAAFWREGFSALMVTDTAAYRYPHYHTAEDTPDKVDYDLLARVTEGLACAVIRLVSDSRPSTPTRGH